MFKVNTCFAILFASIVFSSNCSNKKCILPEPAVAAASAKDTLIYSDYSNTNFPSLVSVDFKNPLYGFIGGVNGFISKTSNGGTIWNDVSVPTSGDIYGLNFFDSNLGFAGSNNGDVFKTIDGGSNWIKVTTPNPIYGYGEFQFFDANTILAAGGSSTTTGAMMKSIDGGTTWTDVTIPGSSTIYDFEFLNDIIGFSCGTNNEIYKTIDGGSTWTKKTINLNILPSNLILLTKIKFSDSNNGYCVGYSSFHAENYILKTFDGGETWNQIPSPANTAALADAYTSIYYNANKQPFIVGGNIANNTPTLITSTDGGNTWDHVSTPATHRLFESAYLDGKAFVVGLNGTFMKSSN